MPPTSLISVSLLCAACALIAAASLTPLVRQLAARLGAVDSPGVRRMHNVSIPRMGGVAIVVAYGFGIAVAGELGLIHLGPKNMSRLLAFLAGAGIIFVVGVMDDLRGLGAKKKLAGQLVAASVAWAFEVRIEPSLEVPFIGLVEFGLVVSYFATIFWILGITNAINLIDGLDGLAGGVVFFASITNVIVAIVSDNSLAVILNAALSGAVLGFLFYNFNPAKIFMGDTGSLFLGFSLSAGALLTARQKESTLASLMVPLIALGLPLTDTILAMARRVIARRSIFSADREHVHHRLVDRGLGHRRAVLILYALSVVLCATSVAFAMGKDWQVGAALLGALLVVVGIVRFAGSLERALASRRKREHIYEGATGSLISNLPDFVILASGASSLEEVLQAFERFLPEEHFPTFSIEGGADGSPIWERQGPRERTEGSRHVLQFPLESEKVKRVIIAYVSSETVVPPQLDVLIRTALNVLATNLERPETMNAKGQDAPRR